jgi:hypothetical protein
MMLNRVSLSEKGMKAAPTVCTGNLHNAAQACCCRTLLLICTGCRGYHSAARQLHDGDNNNEAQQESVKNMQPGE